MPFDWSSGVKDTTARRALEELGDANGGTRYFGNYRLGVGKTDYGVEVFALQVKNVDGRYETIVAVTSAGNVYAKGTVNASQDMASLGYKFLRL